MHKSMMQQVKIEFLLNDPNLTPSLHHIAEKVFNAERITPEEGLLLFQEGSLGFVGALANLVRERLSTTE